MFTGGTLHSPRSASSKQVVQAPPLPASITPEISSLSQTGCPMPWPALWKLARCQEERSPFNESPILCLIELPAENGGKPKGPGWVFGRC